MRLTFIFLIFSVLVLGQSNVLAKDQDSEETTSNDDSNTTPISAPASSNNTIAATVNDLDIFERKIEMYARIVQTYGLAVFLVLWYVFVVWKKQNQDREEDRKERAKWIEQITGLRLLVDPAVKKLTRQQARTILQMAIAGQVDRLTLVWGQFEISFRGGAPYQPTRLGGAGPGDSQEKAIYVFNTDIRLLATDSSAIEASLEKTKEAIEEVVRRTEKESKDMFRWLDQYHQRITLRLDSLQFGDTTLGKI